MAATKDAFEMPLAGDFRDLKPSSSLGSGNIENALTR
jgi:hypothetical protein